MEGIDVSLYIVVSLMMFFEYAVWGAWMPVLAGRLLGPLKMSGKQTGWVYATLPIGCIIATPIAGQLADTVIDPKWILVACHAVGAILLYVAARQKTFAGVFTSMFFYSLCYAATIPLVNSIMFAHQPEIGVDKECGSIFIWAPVAWAIIGYILSGYRATRKVEGDQSDGLKLAAICSIIMVIICCFQPGTEPKGSEGMMAALDLFGDSSFLIFMIVTLCVAGLQQFYFLGTAQMIQDIGMSVKSVPGVMAIAQATQALATLFLLGILLGSLGFSLTLAIGVLCWAALFAVYSFFRVPVLVVPIQAFHGLAYVFFIIVGQIYCKTVAPEEIRSSAQALVIFVQAGVALFLATQLAGFTMSCNADKETGKFNWSKIFMVPLVITIFGAALLLIGMSNPEPKEESKTEVPKVQKIEQGEEVKSDDLDKLLSGTPAGKVQNGTTDNNGDGKKEVTKENEPNVNEEVPENTDPQKTPENNE